MVKSVKKLVTIFVVTILFLMSFSNVVKAEEIKEREVWRTKSHQEDLYYFNLIKNTSVMLDNTSYPNEELLKIAKADTIAWLKNSSGLKDENTFKDAVSIYDRTYKPCNIEANAENTAKLLETLVYNINKGYVSLIKVDMPGNSYRDYTYLVVYGYKESVYETNPMDKLEDINSNTVDDTMKNLSEEERINVTFNDLRVYDVYSGKSSSYDHTGIKYFYLSDYVDSFNDIYVKQDKTFDVDLYAGDSESCKFIDNYITTKYVEEEVKEPEKEEVKETEKEEVKETEKEEVKEPMKEDVVESPVVEEEKEDNTSFLSRIINKIIEAIKNLINKIFKR